MKTWAEESPTPYYLCNVFHRVEYDGQELLRYLAWTAGGDSLRSHFDSTAAYLKLPPVDWTQVDADRAVIAEWKAKEPQPFTPKADEAAYGIVARTLYWGGSDEEWYSLTEDENQPVLYRTLEEAQYARPQDSQDTSFFARACPAAERGSQN